MNHAVASSPSSGERYIGLHIISSSFDYELNFVLYDIETVSARLDNLTRSFLNVSLVLAIA